MRLFVFTAFACALMVMGSCCYAQTHAARDSTYMFDLSPADKILFADNFLQDIEGSFPSAWKQRCYDCQSEVALDNGLQVFSFLMGNDVFAEPRAAIPPNAGVYVTFEFDFMLLDTGKGNVQIQYRSADNQDTLALNIDYYWVSVGWVSQNKKLRTASAGSFIATNHSTFDRRHFDPKTWHHFGISFTKKGMMLYMDHYLVATCGAQTQTKEVKGKSLAGFMPKSFMLAGAAPYEIKNIRFAESDHIPVQKIRDFSKPITGKKFEPQPIYFDVNKTDIKPKYKADIKRLADWLKQNPNATLEIDGYADITGDASDNIRLSDQRAEIVQQALEALGVDGHRLSTHGYGTTKAIFNPNGNAINRRVAFIIK